MYGLCDTVQVLGSEPMTAFEEEFGLRGIGALWVSHWDEAVEGGDPRKVGRVIYCMPTGTLSIISSCAGSAVTNDGR